MEHPPLVILRDDWDDPLTLMAEPHGILFKTLASNWYADKELIPEILNQWTAATLLPPSTSGSMPVTTEVGGVGLKSLVHRHKKFVRGVLHVGVKQGIIIFRGHPETQEGGFYDFTRILAHYLFTGHLCEPVKDKYLP